jgi:hypothetical protein
MNLRSIIRNAPGIAVSIITAFALSAHADDAAPAAGGSTSSTSSSSGRWTWPTDYHVINITPEVGPFTGFGGTIAIRPVSHFGIAAGIDYLDFDLNRTVSGAALSAELRLQTEHVGINWYPWAHRSFYLSGGAIFNQNQFTGNATSTGNLSLDGQAVPKGSAVMLTYKQQKVDPYITIGGNFFYFDSGHHVALSGEIGAFWLGKPNVTVTTTAPPGTVNTAPYQQEVYNDIKKLPVWPIAKLGITVSF